MLGQHTENIIISLIFILFANQIDKKIILLCVLLKYSYYDDGGEMNGLED